MATAYITSQTLLTGDAQALYWASHQSTPMTGDDTDQEPGQTMYDDRITYALLVAQDRINGHRTTRSASPRRTSSPTLRIRLLPRREAERR